MKRINTMWAGAAKKLTTKDKLDSYDRDVRLGYFDQDGAKKKNNLEKSGVARGLTKGGDIIFEVDEDAAYDDY